MDKSRLSILQRFPRLLYVLLAVFFTVVVLRIGNLTLQNEFPLGYDARSYIAAATAIREGHSPYDEAYMGGMTLDVVFSKYLYPPVLAVLLLPLSSLPILPATYICVFLATLSAVLAAVLLRRSIGWKLALFAIFFFPPTWHTIYLGQINLVVASLLLLAVYAVESDQDFRLGVYLALATLLKLTPLFSTGLMILRGYKRTLLTWLLSIIALVLIMLPVVDLGTWFESSHYALRQIWTFPNMVSWTGFLVHYLPGVGGNLALIFSAVLLIFTLTRIRKIPPQLVLSASILLPLLIVRIVWEHHAVMALPALLILWKQSSSTRLVAGLSWLAIAMVGGIAVPIALMLSWIMSCWPDCCDPFLSRGYAFVSDVIFGVSHANTNDDGHHLRSAG